MVSSITTCCEGERQLERRWRQCALGVEVLLDLMQRRMKKGHEEVRLEEGKRIEERGRTRAHDRRQIRADVLADMADSGE
jgi:hypothetical protein